jgi:hypothetical protein
MKCIVCDQRKAKRFCPAKESMICAQCCGEKRVLEINCPETCQFLQTGRTHELELYQRFSHSSDPMKEQKLQRVFSELNRFVSYVEYSLAEERLSSRDLKDPDAAEALDLVIETLKTEENGVLYEKTSNNLSADLLRRRLMQVVTSARLPKEGESGPGLVAQGPERLSLRNAIEGLEAVREVLERHMEEGSALSYLDFLARLMPRRGRVETGGSSLIIPGR